MDATEKDKALTHYTGLLARVNATRAAQGAQPLTAQQIEHDRSLASYDRALGEGRN
jgi:hypothetical protein